MLGRKQKKKLTLIAASILLLIAATIVDRLFIKNDGLSWIAYLPAYLTVGIGVLLSAVKGIGRGQIFDEVFLMSIATVGALIIGEYIEACAVMIFFRIGELFEISASQSARRAISALARSMPDSARVLKEGEFVSVEVDEISEGDVIELLPGERLAADSVIIKGEGYFDTSSITGESVPVYKKEGEHITSGYISLDSRIEARAEATFENSASSRIIALMEEASIRKAKSEDLISKFSLIYTPVVVFSALALAVIPPLLSLGSFTEFIKRALTFLVVSCPCALVISVPLTYFTSVGRAAKSGLIFKSNTALERLANVSVCAFDKTGTLTSGSFAIDRIVSFGESEKRILSLAASLECHSSHPLARCIVKRCDEENIKYSDISLVKEIRGIGMSGQTPDGELFLVNGRSVERFAESFEGYKASEDSSEVCVILDKKLIGVIILSDKVKDGARKSIEALEKMNISCRMLTGDSLGAARRAAEKLGIKNISAQLTPEGKLKEVEELSDTDKVLFVGDGLNDAPVMAMASVSLSMGGIGSDAAVEASDIVLTDDRIEKIPLAIRLAKGAKRIVIENVAFAIGVKLGVLVLGAFGLVGLWWAVFADVGVSVIAILNSMRMLYFK